MPMLLYYVLDESGAIVSMTADEFILMGDYFNAYELNESDYKGRALPGSPEIAGTAIRL